MCASILTIACVSQAEFRIDKLIRRVTLGELDVSGCNVARTRVPFLSFVTTCTTSADKFFFLATQYDTARALECRGMWTQRCLTAFIY